MSPNVTEIESTAKSNVWKAVQGNTVLPSSGCHSFKIKIDEFRNNGICVGVC